MWSERWDLASPGRVRKAMSAGDWRLVTGSPRSLASARSRPCVFTESSLISPAPRTSTAMPPVSRSVPVRRRRGISIWPSRGMAASPVMTKLADCSTGSRKVMRSSPGFISQSATRAPCTWFMVTCSGSWMRASFAAPGESHGLGAFAVGGPLVAAVGEAGGVGEEAAVEREVDSGARNFERDFGDAGEGGRNGEALFACGRRNGEGDFEGDYGAAGMRKKRGKLRGIFSGGGRSEGKRFAVELGFADEEACGDGNADPAVFEDVNGEGGAAGGEIGVNAEVVVNAGERGVDGRRFWFALGGIRFHAEGAVFGD